MSQRTYAIKIYESIIPIHLIDSNLIKKEIYNGRKPLRGENTSRGVIITGIKITGSIKCRLTNTTAPYLLYLITGRETAAGHVPETKGVYWRKLEIDYETPVTFSLIEITEQQCTEYPELKITGFNIIQGNERPMQLEIQTESTEGMREISPPDIAETDSERFYYLPERMRISAAYDDETIIKIDYPEIITEIPLYIEGKSRDKYEANRYGSFRIYLESLQFERFMMDENQSRPYRHECYGSMEILVFFTI